MYGSMYSSLQLSTDTMFPSLPLIFPFMNMVCITACPFILASRSIMLSTSYFPAGWSTSSMYSGETVSSFISALSTIISALNTSLRCICVLLDNTVTFALGKYSSRRFSTLSTIFGKFGCMVGSPLPEKVRVFSSSPLSFIAANLSLSLYSISPTVGKGLFGWWSLFKPHSQYTQSNEHHLPSSGITFMPSDMPSLLLFTGPNIGDLCINVIYFLVFIETGHKQEQYGVYLQTSHQHVETHQPLSYRVYLREVVGRTCESCTRSYIT